MDDHSKKARQTNGYVPQPTIADLCSAFPALDQHSIEDMIQSVGLLTTADLMGVFLDELDKRLDATMGAVKAGNISAVITNAHSLKGSASTFGAYEVQQAARAVEMSARSNALALDLPMERLSASRDRAKKALSQLRCKLVSLNR